MSVKSATILVTGAAGFIGNHVARILHAAGRDVVGTDLSPPQTPASSTFPFFVADIRDLPDHPLVAAGGFDGIIHAGGISGPMLARDNPAELIDINVRGTVQLLDLARVRGMRRFIACSSVSAYGNRSSAEPITEACSLTSSSVYGSSKAAGDILTQTYAERLRLSASTLRIGWVYGPGRRTDGVLHPMIRSALGGAAMRWPSGGDQALQFIHVDDVAAALIAAFDAPNLAHSAYNITGAEIATVRELAGTVRAIMPEADIEIGAGAMEDTDLQGPVVIDLAAGDFGWRPQVRLDDGLRRYAAWLAEHDY